MTNSVVRRAWPWLVAAASALAFLALLSTMVEVRWGPDLDGRPAGTIADIEALRDRSDVNVILVLIDTLRADRLSAYGYERATSPVLAGVAGSGARFDRHLAQSSWTKASMASLWLAMNPTRTGITRYDHMLPPEARSAAEDFAGAGFLTAGIYRNGWVAPTFGFDQGFEVYMRPASRPPPPAVRLENPTISASGTDDDVVAAAIEFLRIHGHKRFFLYLHLMDVHEYLYDESSALFGGSYSDIYDNSIRRMDSVLGVFFEYLADMGLADRTLVAIASDHGEAFRERGALEGHARTVYPETTEVPFLLRFPFRLEQGIAVRSRTRNIDVMPTLLDLVGVPVPEGIDGRSLVPDLLASARGAPLPEAERSAMAYLDQTWGNPSRSPEAMISVSEGALRYLRPGLSGGEEIYDAERDPTELHNFAGEDGEAIARLRARADAHLAEQPPWGAAPTREIGELELNQLRALGYALP